MAAEAEKQGLKCQEDGRSVSEFELCASGKLTELPWASASSPVQYPAQYVPLTVDSAITGKHCFCNHLSLHVASLSFMKVDKSAPHPHIYQQSIMLISQSGLLQKPTEMRVALSPQVQVNTENPQIR